MHDVDPALDTYQVQDQHHAKSVLQELMQVDRIVLIVQEELIQMHHPLHVHLASTVRIRLSDQDLVLLAVGTLIQDIKQLHALHVQVELFQ